MKLIDDWENCWKFLSVQAQAIGVAITTTYAAMYSELKDTLPPKWMLAIVGAVFALGIAGRLISQEKKDPPQ